MFHNYYQRKISSANNLPIHTLKVNNLDFKYTFTMVRITGNKTNLQTAFQRCIRDNDENPETYNAYEQNIFILIEKSDPSFLCDIPKYLEFIDIHVNIKNYKLVSATCVNPGHATSCIMTNDEKIVHIDDSRISVYNFEDAQSKLLSGEKSFYASFLNYRKI